MLLINAIYFKGEWEKEFDKNKTKKREFTNYKK
jgi:serpin B